MAVVICLSFQSYYHLMQICLPFHCLRNHHVIYKLLPTNNRLLIYNVIQLCLVANILLMREWSHVFLLLAIALAWKWQSASLAFQRAICDRTIKQLLNSVSQKMVICQCLPDQSFASAFGSGKLICLPLTNHNILLNFIQ